MGDKYRISLPGTCLPSFCRLGNTIVGGQTLPKISSQTLSVHFFLLFHSSLGRLSPLYRLTSEATHNDPPKVIDLGVGMFTSQQLIYSPNKL